jgi:hypothetical protein
MRTNENLSDSLSDNNINNPSDNQLVSSNVTSKEDEILKIFENLAHINTFTGNLSQDVIYTNKDKLRLAYDKCLLNRDSRKHWHTPASLFLTVLLVLLTSEFKDVYFLKKDVLFGMAAMLCLVFLILAIVSWIKTNKIPKDDFENFIQEIQQ